MKDGVVIDLWKGCKIKDGGLPKPGKPITISGIRSAAQARRALDFLTADHFACLQAFRDAGADETFIDELLQETREKLDGLMDEAFGVGASTGRGN
jgi:hypothetical protein